jgi:hypothetical protein
MEVLFVVPQGGASSTSGEIRQTRPPAACSATSALARRLHEGQGDLSFVRGLLADPVVPTVYGFSSGDAWP